MFKVQMSLLQQFPFYRTVCHLPNLPVNLTKAGLQLLKSLNSSVMRQM
jgi:hypothetical protein